jgi:hypothetical protein
MKKWLRIITLATTPLTFGAVVTPNGPWQTVTTPATIPGTTITSSVNTNGTANAFWNNTSLDSATQCANIGCYVVGSSYFNGVSQPKGPGLTNPVYLGNNDGTAVTDFNFTGGGAVETAQLVAKIAGNAPREVFGWYDSTLTPSQLTAGNMGTNWGVIYTGSSNPGPAVPFTPTSNFGLWFLPNLPNGGSPTTAQIVTGFGNDGTFTQSSKNTLAGDTGLQHFALFASSAVAAQTLPASFWVGMEDGTISAGADSDYNDTIVQLQLLQMQSVPESKYYVFLLISLAGLAWVHYRRKKPASARHSV